jgi:hypothetical protein
MFLSVTIADIYRVMEHVTITWGTALVCVLQLIFSLYSPDDTGYINTDSYQAGSRCVIV